MHRLILLLLISFFSSAKIAPVGKVNYLIELLEIKNKFDIQVLKSRDRLSKTFLVDASSLRFFNRVHEKVYPWKGLKERYVSYFQTQFKEEEINKLIAIYELPEIKKLKQEFKFSENRILKEFFDSKEKLLEFNKLYNRSDQVN